MSKSSRETIIAWRMLGDREEAEDVAQDAFVRVFLRIHTWRREGAFSTWLYRVVANLCFDRLRRPGRRGGLSARAGKSSSELTNPMPEATKSESSIETAVVVQQILGRISPKLRAVLVMREVEGLDYRDIASALRIPLGTVRSRLSAARLAFRDLYLQCTSTAR